MTGQPLALRAPAALAVVAAQALVAAAFVLGSRPDASLSAVACGAAWLVVIALGRRGATAALAVTLALAALSAVAGAPAILPVAAACAGVVAWDLSLLARAPRGGVAAAGDRTLRRSHLRALAAGLLPGLGVAVLLGNVRLAIPFAVMLLVGALLLIALDRAARRWG